MTTPTITPTVTVLEAHNNSAPSTTSEEARVAKEFEAMLLSQAVNQMLETVDIGSMGGGFAEETWRSFLARAIAEEISGTGVTKVSESVQSAIAGYQNLENRPEKPE